MTWSTNVPFWIQNTRYTLQYDLPEKRWAVSLFPETLEEISKISGPSYTGTWDLDTQKFSLNQEIPKEIVDGLGEIFVRIIGPNVPSQYRITPPADPSAN